MNDFNLAPLDPRRLADLIADDIHHSGGSTRVLTGQSPTEGYAVASPEGALTLHVPAPLFESNTQYTPVILAWLDQQGPALNNRPVIGQRFVTAAGAWVDRDARTLHLERVRIVPDLARARELGAQNGQRFIYDLAGRREVPVCDALTTLTAYAFNVYAVPAGYAVADPLDGPGGFYAEARTLADLARIVQQFSAPVSQ